MTFIQKKMIYLMIFPKDNKKDVNNSLDSWSKDGILTLLSNTSQWHF